MALTYYSALDSVAVAKHRPVKEQQINAAAAAGAVMLGMLVQRQTPVLSGPQAYDNAYLLGVLERPSPQSAGLLELIATDLIQVRLLPNERKQKPTLLDDFKLRLRDKNFHFSAWPELRDPPIRAGVLAALEGEPDAAPEAVQPRLRALRNLDQALRDSPAQEVAALSAGPSLVDLCTAGLGRLDLSGEAYAARQRLRESSATPLANKRIWWYDAIKRSREAHPRLGLFHDQAAMLVDLAYNQVICTSLGAQGMEVIVSGAAYSAQKLAASDPDLNLTVEQRHVQLALQTDTTDWFTWSQVPDLMQQLGRFTAPVDRLTRLQEVRSEVLIPAAQGGSVGLALLMGFATVAPASVATAMVESALPGLPGGMLGALIGIGVGAPLAASLVHRIQAHDTKRRRTRILGQAREQVVVSTPSRFGRLRPT